MKKIIYLIISLSLVISISGCAGYKPIFSSQNIEFIISKHKVTGNKTIGNKIYAKLNKLSIKKNNTDVKKIHILINSSKDKSSTSKDSAGKIIEYRITLSTNIEVNDSSTDEKILDQNFTSSVTYRVQDQYSETLKLENQSLENLINKGVILAIC